MEVLRSIKITVEVDTNKATYRETFDDDEIDVMFDWLKDYTGIDLRPTQRAVDGATCAVHDGVLLDSEGRCWVCVEHRTVSR